MSADCVFCKIAKGEIPSRSVAGDDRYYAFHDLDPKAPTHVLVIPRAHIASLDGAGDERMLGGLLAFVRQVARDLGVAESGYRTVINTNRDAGQAVAHLHAHILGGRRMTWPPG
ncbi:MAG TPA: histidine triad nucleotide-binding protein [Gemmatimonadales bacterium]|nr:histidine triad nucleotide-binding protein [Gemmatimonadales bacterium]